MWQCWFLSSELQPTTSIVTTFYTKYTHIQHNWCTQCLFLSAPVRDLPRDPQPPITKAFLAIIKNLYAVNLHLSLYEPRNADGGSVTRVAHCATLCARWPSRSLGCQLATARFVFIFIPHLSRVSTMALTFGVFKSMYVCPVPTNKIGAPEM